MIKLSKKIDGEIVNDSLLIDGQLCIAVIDDTYTFFTPNSGDPELSRKFNTAYKWLLSSGKEHKVEGYFRIKYVRRLFRRLDSMIEQLGRGFMSFTDFYSMVMIMKEKLSSINVTAVKHKPFFTFVDMKLDETMNIVLLSRIWLINNKICFRGGNEMNFTEFHLLDDYLRRGLTKTVFYKNYKISRDRVTIREHYDTRFKIMFNSIFNMNIDLIRGRIE